MPYDAIAMSAVNSEFVAEIQSELLAGESILWAGQPDPRVLFHKEDSFLIPFSLLWGGFAIFWEGAVAGLWANNVQSRPWAFGMIWGIPFVLIGQYVIWGRFLYAAWKKKRTYYAVTNRRVLVVQNGWKRQVASSYLDSLPTLIKETSSGGRGTLRFAPREPMWSGMRGWGVWDAMAVGDSPTFIDIEDVDAVYRLVSDLREEARSGKGTTFWSGGSSR